MFDKLVDLFISSLRLFQFFTVVPAYGGGVILRLGRYHRPAAAGFHWMWPFRVEECLSTNVVPETMLVGPQSLTTRDGVSLVISTVVTFAIDDVKVFLLEIEGAGQVIEDATYGIVAHMIMERTWAELAEIDLANELGKTVRRAAKRYGVQIVQVQIADFTRSRSLRLVLGYANKFPVVNAVN
jgi:regulator of protease activity HflC (stomatin/prohibitin superfamily)